MFVVENKDGESLASQDPETAFLDELLFKNCKMEAKSDSLWPYGSLSRIPDPLHIKDKGMPF